MDSYQAFRAFFERVTNRPATAILTELNRMRQDKQATWAQLHVHVTNLFEPSVVGSADWQARIARAKFDAVASEMAVPPTDLSQVVAIVYQHYRNHGPELEAALHAHTLIDASPTEMVNALLANTGQPGGSS